MVLGFVLGLDIVNALRSRRNIIVIIFSEILPIALPISVRKLFISRSILVRYTSSHK